MAGEHSQQGQWLRVPALRREVGVEVPLREWPGGASEFGVEPTTLAAAGWETRPGAEGAKQLLSMARNVTTAAKYARVLNKWFRFCEVGHLGRPYDPLVFNLAKWWLFAGFMLNPEVNRDKDLNVVRSAMNRYFEDNGRGRPALGLTVRTVISKFKDAMEDKLRAAGVPVGLNRQPCPEQAFVELLQLGEVVFGRLLRQVACQLLQLLCWFRSNSMAGMQSSDVFFTDDGWLNVMVRFVKMQPERRLDPAHLRIAPGCGRVKGRQHVRDRLLSVLRRATALEPGWQCYVARAVKAQTYGGSAAASLMTQDLRDLVGSRVSVPPGVTMSSHSWREMGAVSSSRAGWCLFKMMRRGLWKRVETMIASYIDPFPYFPFSPVLAELYDDLAPGAVFIAGSHARSDGHAEQQRWPGRL